MIADLLQYLSDNNLIYDHQKVLLTVSGGIDSMVMTHLFKQVGIEYAIAHCNFGLRGNESDEDAFFVQEVAQVQGIPFYIKRFDTKEYAKQNKLSIQEAARSLRYNWFESLIKETDLDLYATAHHFDDQTETFFINLFRGTGISGLRGILPKNGNCIRPLLFASRARIVKFAIENRINYREDSSNANNDYLRNRIRHNILPALEKTNSGYRIGIQNTFKALSSTEHFVLSQIDALKKRMFRKCQQHFEISIVELLKNECPDFVLYELLKPFDFNFAVVKNIIKSLNGEPGKIFLSFTHEVILDRKTLLISPLIIQETEIFEIDENKTEIFQPLHFKLEIKPLTKKSVIEKNPDIAFLDFNKIKFPLRIRKYQQGDYFYPLGMKNRKKLSDFFIDNKFSLLEKRNTWLLLSGKEIAWVVGKRIDERFKLTSQSENAIIIRLI